VTGQKATGTNLNAENSMQMEFFLLQVIEEPTRSSAMLDLVLTNKEGLVGNVKVQPWLQ